MNKLEDIKMLPVVVEQVEEKNQSEKSYYQPDWEDEKTVIKPLHVVREFDFRTNPPTKAEKLSLGISTSGKHSDYFVIEYDGSNLNDKKSFLLKTSAHTANFNLEMTEKQFRALKKEWYESANLREIYTCAGTQAQKHVWANAELSLSDYQLSYSTDDNSVQEKQSLVDLTKTCKAVLYPSQKSSTSILKEFFSIFRATFPDYAVLTTFGVALAVVYWDIFQDVAQGFSPVLFVGESESGKSTLLMLIAAIYGLDSNSYMSGDSTPYAIMQELSSRLNIPVCIEELQPEVLSKYEQIVKNVYARISRARGKSEGIEKLPIFTSFIATSNYFFPKPSPQLLNRLAFAILKKGQFNLSNFPYFDMEKQKELSQILPILLRFRPIIKKNYSKIFDILSENISNGGRHLSTLAISSTLWLIINKILGYELVDWRSMSIEYDKMLQSYLNTEVQSGDVIMNNITILVETEKLENGIDWKLVKDNILRLNLNRYLEKYNTSNPKTMMKSSQFRLLVANDKRFNTQTTSMKGINRAISIDVSENEYLLDLLRNQQKRWILTYGDNTNDEI